MDNEAVLEAKVIKPSEEGITQAGLLLAEFRHNQKRLDELDSGERILFLNRLLARLIDLPQKGTSIYAFSGSDTVYVKGLTCNLVYADIDPVALVEASEKDPNIETLQTNLFAGLPSNYDGQVDVLIERNFPGQPTVTTNTFIRSIRDGGYYLLWGGTTKGSGSVITEVGNVMGFLSGNGSVHSASLISCELRLDEDLRNEISRTLCVEVSPNADFVFPWGISRVIRHA